MEESDFDQKIIELANEYAYATSGGLLWTLWDKKDSFTERDIEWIKANLIFFLVRAKEIERNASVT